MKDADNFNTAWKAMSHAMKSSTKFTPDEQAALTAIDVILDADGDTTKEQDMVMVQCMKKYCTQNENY